MRWTRGRDRQNHGDGTVGERRQRTEKFALLVRRVLLVDRSEFVAEVQRDRLVIVRFVLVRRHMMSKLDARFQFCLSYIYQHQRRDIDARTHLEQITFIQEQDDVDLREELVRDEGLPEQHRVLQSIHPRVLGQNLIKRRYGRQEYYGIHCLKKVESEFTLHRTRGPQTHHRQSKAPTPVSGSSTRRRQRSSSRLVGVRSEL